MRVHARQNQSLKRLYAVCAFEFRCVGCWCEFLTSPEAPMTSSTAIGAFVISSTKGNNN